MIDGQASRQHGLAGARRPDHEQVVGAGHGDLERALDARLAEHVGEVGVGRRRGRCRSVGGVGPARRPGRRRRRAARRPRAAWPPGSTAGRGRGPPRAALAPGTSSARSPRRRALCATASTPATGRTAPSSPSSPMAAARGRARSRLWPVAQSKARAIGRSNAGPSLRTSAGARLTVMRREGNSKRELTIAVRTRSRLSCTAASGSPTMVKAGAAATTSASTATGWPSRPVSASLCDAGEHGLAQAPRVKAARRWRTRGGRPERRRPR